MIYDHGVALHGAINGEIAAVARIGDLAVLEDLDCNLYGIHGGATVSHQVHSSFGSTVGMSARQRTCHLGGYPLVARLKVDVLVLDAVVPCARMDEDAGNPIALLPSLAGEHVGYRPLRTVPSC